MNEYLVRFFLRASDFRVESVFINGLYNKIFTVRVKNGKSM
jgi:hypothetical protein